MLKYTKKEAEVLFKEMNPDYKEMDKYKQRLLWNVFTDALCKDRYITQIQYSTWLYPSYFKK